MEEANEESVVVYEIQGKYFEEHFSLILIQEMNGLLFSLEHRLETMADDKGCKSRSLKYLRAEMHQQEG